MVLVPHEIISNSLVTPDLTRDTAFAGNMVTPNQNLYFLIKKVSKNIHDMAYLLNNKVSEKSTIKQALTRVFGVGPFLADSFCKKVGISPTLKLEKVSTKQLSFLTDTIIKDKVHLKQEELSRYLYENIVRLAQVRSYRGVRRKKGLPLRGQRTRTNFKTAKRHNSIKNRLR